MTSVRDLLPGVPLVHSPFFDEVLATSDWDAETRRVAISLNRDGFVTIDFPEPDLDAIAEDIGRNVFGALPWQAWRAGEVCGLERVVDAWRVNESVRRIAVNASLQALISRVYGREAFPFQTLNFGIGSQQGIHIDKVHFTSTPDDFMCGVWLALEDVEPGAGPLRYYPGSHRWPLYLNEHVGRPPPVRDVSDEYGKLEAVWTKMAQTYGAEPVEFFPRKGQALIWAAGLHHGGAPHTNRAASRQSQVTHYLFKDCAYWQPLMSDPFSGQIAFGRFSDIRTGLRVTHSVNGAATPEALIDLTRPALLGGPVPPPRNLVRRAWDRARRMTRL